MNYSNPHADRDTEAPSSIDTSDQPALRPVHNTSVTELESLVADLISTEPKDFARATVLMYDLCRLRGQDDQSRYLVDTFDLSAMVLYDVLALVRTLRDMDHDPTRPKLDAEFERADDLIRLATIALAGDTSADIIQHLIDLRDGISQSREDEGRVIAATRSGDRLAHLVNAFFFDRLTAMPALRDYVVRLELGL